MTENGKSRLETRINPRRELNFKAGIMPFMASQEPKQNITPVDLKRIAASISRGYADKGAIVITSGKDGIRVGVHGLELHEAQDALCVAIYHVVSKALE